MTEYKSDMFTVIELPPELSKNKLPSKEDPFLKQIANLLPQLEKKGIRIDGQSTTQEIVNLFDDILSKEIKDLTNTEKFILALSGFSQVELKRTDGAVIGSILRSSRFNLFVENVIKSSDVVPDDRVPLSLYSALHSTSCRPSEPGYKISLFDVEYFIKQKEKKEDDDLGFSLRRSGMMTSKSFLEALSRNRGSSTYRQALQEMASEAMILVKPEQW